MSKFKVGDKVKYVLGSEVFTIKEIEDNFYTVEENIHLWRGEFLILVEKTKSLKEITEKELADMGYVIKR